MDATKYVPIVAFDFDGVTDSKPETLFEKVLDFVPWYRRREA